LESRLQHIFFPYALLALAGLLLALYLTFLTQTYYWDGVLFSLRIEQASEGQLPVSALLHPNHLLYSVLGYYLYQTCARVGLHLRAIEVLQILNAIVSVGAACLVYRFAVRITRSAFVALFCALIFACGATWWKFSTDADSYILSATLLLAALYLIFDNDARWPVAAILHATAMFFHELASFGYLAAVALLCLTKPRRRQRLFGYLLASGSTVAVVYALAYRSADHHPFPTLLSWISSSSPVSNVTHSLQQLTVVNLVSYVKLFAGGRWSLVREQFSLLVAVSLAMACLLLACGFWLLRFAPQERIGLTHTGSHRFPLLLWTWITPYVVFLSWFEPGNAFYKLFIWPAIVLAIGWFVVSNRGLYARIRALVLFTLALAAWNFGAFIYPHAQPSADPVLQLAKTIDRELPKNATIYYRVFSPDDWYLKYFAPGRTWLEAPADPGAFRHGEKASEGPVCLETTALEATSIETGPLRWRLLEKGHHVKLECLKVLRGKNRSLP